jgi:hypothetical protein
MIILVNFFLTSSILTSAQNNNGFPLGNVTVEQLQMKVYPKDSSANAVLLDEFGEAYIDNGGDNNLILEYKAKFKILSKTGLEEANFRIPLYKNGSRKQFIQRITATTYNLSNNSIVTAKLNPKEDVFNTEVSEHWNEVSFTLPSVVVGSVFEVSYKLESPFLFNFWPWKFQSHIPKVKSEYWARIPGNYVYNIAFKGFLQLSLNQSSIVKDCFTPGDGRYKAECALYKYMIKDVPAFIEEDFMTAKSNFISSIDYELSEIRFFDGRVEKYTKTWKDVDSELINDETFGKQIRKARNLHEKKVLALVSTITDASQKARAIYEYIKNWYRWNGEYGKYTSQDVKTSFEKQDGNVGDINLALIGALQAAGLNADPVILATRDFGLPHQLFPVISEFNYVVARIEDSDPVMLDATEDLLPYGMLPERCLNGKGRLISKVVEESRWVDIRPSQKKMKKILLDLTLENDAFKGLLTITSSGYEAFEKRTKIIDAGSEQAYLQRIQSTLNEIVLSDYKVENFKDPNQPLVETFGFELKVDQMGAKKLYLIPFLIDRWQNNPFRSNQRLYPVDFGAPVESTFHLTLNFPPQYFIEENLENSAYTLPGNGGRFLLNATSLENKLSVTSIITLNKMVYSSNEYHSLKELFNRIIESQNSQIVFSQK